MARLGRPSKFIPSTVAAILSNLRHGSPRGHAAAAAGVSPSTFFYWYAHGEDFQVFGDFLEDATRPREGEQEFFPFEVAVRMQEARFVGEKVRQINKIGEKNWLASAFMLERRFPAEFGRRAVSDANIGEIQQEIEKLLSARDESNSVALDNTGTDLIISVDGEHEIPNIAALDKIVQTAHNDYVSSYIIGEKDSRRAENLRDISFGAVLEAYRALRSFSDQTVSEKQAA